MTNYYFIPENWLKEEVNEFHQKYDPFNREYDLTESAPFAEFEHFGSDLMFEPTSPTDYHVTPSGKRLRLSTN